MKPIHRRLDSLQHPTLHRLAHRIEQLVEGGALFLTELVEHVVRQTFLLRRTRPDSNPEPRVFRGAEGALDALETVVAACGTAGTQAESAARAGHVGPREQQP